MISIAKPGFAVYLLLQPDYSQLFFSPLELFYWIHNDVNELIINLLTGREIFQIFAG